MIDPNNAEIRREAIRKAITGHVSYDGTTQETCPHCKGVLKASSHWFDHVGRLASLIRVALDLPIGTEERIEEILRSIPAYGKESIDVPDIAQKVVKELWP